MFSGDLGKVSKEWGCGPEQEMSILRLAQDTYNIDKFTEEVMRKCIKEESKTRKEDTCQEVIDLVKFCVDKYKPIK
jgi:hypothetical protein